MQKILLLLLLASCSHQTLVTSTEKQRATHSAKAQKFMVATQGEAASKAALSMIEQGGNVFDAFAATSFAISVERPQSTGIGGGGFAVFYSKKDKKVRSLDFREVGPTGFHAKIYLDKEGNEIPGKSRDGALSVGVPGIVDGVWRIHQKYGKLPWKTILQPAIELAENGFRVYPHLEKALQDRAEILRQDSDANKIFYSRERELRVGELLVQKDLATTLKLIAQRGPNGFYKGKTAKAIVETLREQKSPITYKDLKNYKSRWRKPVQGRFEGHDIYSMGPPSSGGIHILQILNTIKNDELPTKPLEQENVWLISKAMQQAFADRAKHLGDEDFSRVPKEGLTSAAYGKKTRQDMDLTKWTPADEVNPGDPTPYESPETTHFSMMDGEGNIIASTQTINWYFGSGVMAKGTGIVLNNEMDDFSTKVNASNLFGAVGGSKNLPAKGKRPLSSMSPTIVMKKGQPILAAGSPSGTRILTCVMQTLLNYLGHKLPLYESLATSRFHQQWKPDVLFLEPELMRGSWKNYFTSRGLSVKEKDLGCKVQAVAREGKELIGASDPRGEGLAIGL